MNMFRFHIKPRPRTTVKSSLVQSRIIEHHLRVNPLYPRSYAAAPLRTVIGDDSRRTSITSGQVTPSDVSQQSRQRRQATNHLYEQIDTVGSQGDMSRTTQIPISEGSVPHHTPHSTRIEQTSRRGVIYGMSSGYRTSCQSMSCDITSGHVGGSIMSPACSSSTQVTSWARRPTAVRSLSATRLQSTVFSEQRLQQHQQLQHHNQQQQYQQARLSTLSSPPLRDGPSTRPISTSLSIHSPVDSKPDVHHHVHHTPAVHNRDGGTLAVHSSPAVHSRQHSSTPAVVQFRQSRPRSTPQDVSHSIESEQACRSATPVPPTRRGSGGQRGLRRSLVTLPVSQVRPIIIIARTYDGRLPTRSSISYSNVSCSATSAGGGGFGGRTTPSSVDASQRLSELLLIRELTSVLNQDTVGVNDSPRAGGTRESLYEPMQRATGEGRRIRTTWQTSPELETDVESSDL